MPLFAAKPPVANMTFFALMMYFSPVLLLTASIPTTFPSFVISFELVSASEFGRLVL